MTVEPILNDDSALRLLIVEDNANEAEALISAIKAAGFGVRALRAEDPKALQDGFERHHPDLVLHSIDHPDIGLELSLESARRSGQHIPVIALAGAGADVVQCMQMGAHDLVAKENKEHLRLVVNRANESRRAWVSNETYVSALDESEKRCRTLLDSSKDPICYVHDGMHVYANESYLKCFGFTSFDEIEGMPFMDLVAPDDQPSIKGLLRGLGRGQVPATPTTSQITDSSGGFFNAELHFSNASIEGEPCAQIVIRTGGHASELEEQIVQMSQRDPVTGLLNRKFSLSRLDEAIGDAANGGEAYTLTLITITNVPDIRQLVGVAEFDTVIAAFAKRLTALVHSGDVVARFSDEAFLVLSATLEPGALDGWMRSLWEKLSEHPIEVGRYTVPTIPALGAARIDHSAPETNELIVRAETALIRAQQGPAPHTAVYTPKKGEMSQRELDAYWSEQIVKAQKEDRLRTVFQPIVSLHGDPGERYELFLRLLDPHGELIGAAKFIPSAERTGMASRLDRHLIEYAAQQIQEAQAQGRTVTLFLKLSAGALQDPEMETWLSETIQRYGLNPGSLIFELKEVTLVNHLKQARILSERLRELNCGLAIDDFGTGLKPFQLLKAISVDYLKIDRGLMEHMADDKEHQDKLRAMTGAAHEQKKLVVAPFVENAATLSILWETGVNYIQGNFLQEPTEGMDYDFSAFG